MPTFTCPSSHAHPHMPTLPPTHTPTLTPILTSSHAHPHTLTHTPSHAHPHTPSHTPSHAHPHTPTHTPSQVLPPVGGGSKGAVHSAADSTCGVSWATAGGAGAYVAVFTKTRYRGPIPVACRCRWDLTWSIRCEWSVLQWCAWL